MEEQQELFKNIKSIDRSKGTKICIKCNEEKPLERFITLGRRDLKNNHVRMNICKKCESKKHRQVAELKKTHVYPNENYKCPICFKIPEQIIPETNGKTSPFVLDHDHKTGAFKGWLCNKCNSALGFFEDDINYVRRALNYLEEYEDRCQKVNIYERKHTDET
tara:strand:+ start:65 stop:553 length:489 start_codon:yes stop_codon:yes gene_type:complete